MKCPICSQGMVKLLDLPRFPITEKYEPWTPEFEEGRGLVDQSFHYCEACSHGRLGTVVPDLYGSDYRTSTSKSDGARQAVSRFAYFIKEHCGEREYHIDIGGNEGEMTKYFDNVVVIDPHAKESPATIEEADLSQWSHEPKIIMSSHTIEHLVDPEVMIAKCAAVMRDEDYLALQFPSLELLVEDARIDQIHHQHIHYFSERSIRRLLARNGLAVFRTSFDPSHWGALMVLARLGSRASYKGDHIYKEQILDARIVFLDDISTVRIPKGAIALGAALMLPVLAYWLPELRNIVGIWDEDPGKEGLRYINFNKKISSAWYGKDRNVVITAIGSNQAARSLTNKAIDAGARRIILPLHTL